MWCICLCYSTAGLDVRLGFELCPEEQEFLQKRKKVAAAALKRVLHLEEDLQDDEVRDQECLYILHIFCPASHPMQFSSSHLIFIITMVLWVGMWREWAAGQSRILNLGYCCLVSSLRNCHTSWNGLPCCFKHLSLINLLCLGTLQNPGFVLCVLFCWVSWALYECSVGQQAVNNQCACICTWHQWTANISSFLILLLLSCPDLLKQICQYKGFTCVCVCVLVNQVPIVAIMTTGGGIRALTSMYAHMLTIQKLGILDCVSYLTGLSGTTW